MSTEAAAFLGALFGDKPSALYIYIWTLQDKRSTWFTDIQKAATYAVAQAAQKDVYVGVALSPKAYGEGARVPNAQAAGMVALWVDVDVKHPHHKKQNLPPSDREALELIDSLGLAPSVVVHSGHGLQAWWLFREPWVFADDAERQAGAALSERWTKALKAKAAAKGWDVDSTFDLARILRIPGTLNRKGEPPKPVRIIQPTTEWSGNPNAVLQRYDPSEFEAYLPEELPGAPQRTRYTQNLQGGAITLNASATPPFDKWEALLEAETKVRLTWEGKRKDLQDQSGSSYDFALANYCVAAGWTDQEITDLLIARRRKAGEDLKLRVDYYERTIANVRGTRRKDEAQERLEDALHAQTKEEAQPPPKAEKGQQAPQAPPKSQHVGTILESLSELWNVKLLRVVKYLSDPPQYRLETGRGAIMLGGIEAIADHRTFRNRVAAATNVLIPRYKAERWDGMAQALLNVCEEESIGAEATDEGQAHAWITAYLDTYPPNPDMAEALPLQHPFVHDGHTYLVGGGLRKWLQVNQGERLTAKAMGTILRAGDCEAEVMGCEIEGKQTTRNVWRLPNKYGPS
jgi:hypothetical protein